MHLEPHVAKLREELAIAAEAGGQEARELAERLTAPLESAVRLALLEALSVATEEITRELAPGSVDLRLRRGEPAFVVSPPAVGALEDEADGGVAPGMDTAPPVSYGAKDGAMSRINLRLPEHLKARAEQAAEREGLSVNAWLVRTVAEAVEQTDHDQRPRRQATPRGQRYTGWAR
jgi:HicB family